MPLLPPSLLLLLLLLLVMDNQSMEEIVLTHEVEVSKPRFELSLRKRQ